MVQRRLLFPLLVVLASLSLPPTTQAFPFNWFSWLWDSKPADVSTIAPAIEPRVGPGCADGFPYYPGIPAEVNCEAPDAPLPDIITNEYDCSSYFYCDQGIASLVCCPAGYLYDPPMLTCDDPPHVNCGSRPILEVPTTDTTTTTTTTTTETTTTTTPPTTTTTTTTEVIPDSTTPDGSTPDVTTPEPTTTTTTTTTTAEPTTTTTPEPTTTTTTTPEPTTTTTTTTTEAPPPPIDSKCDDMVGYTGNLPFEGDCTKYYNCDGITGSEGTIESCPVGDYGQMVYNPTTQACDNQWHYPCENHIIYTSK